ncbi:MAG: hypothetical protein WCX90_03105 [Thiohalomonadaceae bacterium]
MAAFEVDQFKCSLTIDLCEFCIECFLHPAQCPLVIAPYIKISPLPLAGEGLGERVAAFEVDQFKCSLTVDLCEFCIECFLHPAQCPLVIAPYTK